MRDINTQKSNKASFKSILSFLMATYFVISIMFSAVLPVSADEGQGKTDISVIGSSSEVDDSSEGYEGEYEEVIRISSEQDLIDLAKKVNDGNNLSDVLVELLSDITISRGDWVPIGSTPETPFSGEFDGKGHYINRLTVSKDIKGGLFGYLIDAKITGLNIVAPQAPNSTYGFFYVAKNTNIELSNYENGVVVHNVATRAMSPVAYSAPWTGGKSDKWQARSNWSGAPIEGDVYIILTPDELADFADVALGILDGSTLPSGTPFPDFPFAGTTISIQADLDMGGVEWTPIGDYFLPYYGNVTGSVGGQGQPVTIKNLKVTTESGKTGGLFATLSGGTVNNLIFDGAKITSESDADTGTGALAARIEGAVVDNIVIKNSRFSDKDTAGVGSHGVGGLAGEIDSQTIFLSVTSAVSNVIIQDCYFASDSEGRVGGVAVYYADASVSNISVINSTFEIGIYGGGLFAENFSSVGSDSITNTLLYGLEFIGKNTGSTASGLTSQIYALNGDATLIDGVQVSNITATNMDSLYLVAEQEHVASVSSVLTDVLIASGATKVEVTANPNVLGAVSGVAWESYSGYSEPSAGSNNNGSLITSEMVDGRWAPSTAWSAQANSYPQLTVKKNSKNSLERKVSGLASVAVIPYYIEDQNYNDPAGVRGVKLYHETANGDAVKWDISNTPGITKTEHTDKDGKTFTRLNTESNIAVGVEVTASIDLGALEKKFPKVMIKDGVLKEDVSARIDGGNNSSWPVIDLEAKILLKYLENISANPDITGNIEVYSLQLDSSNNIIGRELEEIIIANKHEKDVFEVEGVAKTVEIFPVLRPNSAYEISYPTGTVLELSNGNLSEAVIVRFKTKDVSSPGITLLQSTFTFSEGNNVELSKLMENVKIYDENTKNTLVYDGAKDGKIPKVSDSKWDAGNPNKSATNVLADATLFPKDGKNKQMYYIAKESELIGNPKPGTYKMYILAMNSSNRTGFASFNIVVSSRPIWKNDNIPKDHIHMPWIGDISAIKIAARQNASAYVLMGDDKEVPCQIEVTYNVDEWNKISADKDYPATIKVALTVLDTAGNPSDLSLNVDVFLDKNISWTITPSPVVMNDNSTYRQVEERINFLGLNINRKDIRFDHNDNNYRKAGLYYVDISSTHQFTTKCKLNNCETKPAEYVKDEFMVQIQKTPGAETTAYWGIAAKEILEKGHSQEMITLNPSNYLLPSYTLEALNSQKYGKIQMNFFDQYRWNVYSTTLNNSIKWGDYYSLQVTGVNEKKIENLTAGNSSAVQFVFTNEGRLFGEVEFEMNLANARKVHTNLPKDNLGLYRYNNHTDKLELVSHIMVDSTGKWGSAVIRETLPTVYVIKETAKEDKLAEDLTMYNKNGVLVFGNSRAGVNPEYKKAMVDYDVEIDPDYSGRLFFGGTTMGEYTNVSKDLYQDNSLLIAALIAIAAFAVLGIAALIVIKKLNKRGRS